MQVPNLCCHNYVSFQRGIDIGLGELRLSMGILTVGGRTLSVLPRIDPQFFDPGQ